MNYVLIRVGYTVDSYEVKVPKLLDDWVEPSSNTSKGEPTFYKLDNPGGWISISHCPVFLSVSQGGKYKAHCLPDV